VMEFLLQLVLNGLVVGSIYSLVALGFVIIYKSSGILNFAQGEFLLLGAYVFLAISSMHAPLYAALLLTFAFSAILGIVLERVVLTAFFRYARPGIAMRATADSQQVALSMGISVRRIFALSWSIAAVVSAAGGVLLGTMRGGVDGSLAVLGLKVLPVVIVGGLDSIGGAILGGLLVGVLENLAGGYLDPVFGGGVKEVAPFVALVLILMVKPYGLFGKVRIERV